MTVGSKRSANLRVSMSSQEENSSNSDESSFLSEADDLESFNSESGGDENDLLACSLTNLNQSTRAIKFKIVVRAVITL